MTDEQINTQNNEQMNTRGRIGPVFRWLAGFVALCSFLGIIGALLMVATGVADLFSYEIGYMLAACVIGSLLYGYVAVTGRNPPKPVDQLSDFLNSDVQDDGSGIGDNNLEE